MLARLVAFVGRLARALFLFAVFVASAYLAFNYWVRRGVVAVPELAGLEEGEARARLDQRGLHFRAAEASQWSAAVVAGQVIESRPRAGSFVKRGAEIEAVLSLGERRVLVPDLAGKALSAARLTLETYGLAVGSTLSVVSDSGPAGAVVGQQPAAGAELAPGSKIRLLVALGAGSTAWLMPDLVSRRYEPVRDRLEDQGFRFGSVTFERYEGVASGTVLRQAPLPGHPLRRSDAISLVVAGAPEGSG